MKTLFTIGNKRSGTSLLVRLLNLHPNLFISHESDIAWILYQRQNGLPANYQGYLWDGPAGMKGTLNSAKEQIKRLPNDRAPSDEELRTAFFAVQQQLMHNSLAGQTPELDKQEILWIGDKKPVQHSDPEIRSFVTRLFPDARYLHIIRHPGPVLVSMQKAANSWKIVPEYWKAGAFQILERWLAHEEWVLMAKKELGSAIHTLRYEDLLATPVEQMQKCFKHLQLDMTTDLKQNIKHTVTNQNLSKKVSISKELQNPMLASVMDIYGYDFDGTVRKL